MWTISTSLNTLNTPNEREKRLIIKLVLSNMMDVTEVIKTLETVVIMLQPKVGDKTGYTL